MAWTLDGGRAEHVARALRWEPTEGVPALVSALARWLPAGSTAKLDAVAAGLDPPGADPAAAVDALLAAHRRGASQPSWSCWVRATLLAALVETFDLGHAEVAATRRLGAPSGVVDFHSAVVVRHADGRSWLIDPHFVAIGPGPGSPEVEANFRQVRSWRVDRADGRWSYWMAAPQWPERWRYLVVAPTLDAEDVLAFCRISATHTGVPPRPAARVLDESWIVDAFIDAEGQPWLREWRDRAATPPDAPVEPRGRWVSRTPFVSWADACAAFHRRTGVRVH